MRRLILGVLLGLAAITAGLGSAAALAGGGCEHGECKTTTTTGTGGTFTTIEQPPATITQTVTVTLPAVTTPAETLPAQTVVQTIVQTVPSHTVTVTRGKPTCAHGDWDINAPRCKPKLIAACKGPYRREILRWCLRYEKATKPTVKARIVTRAGGVTGACDPRHPCRVH